MQQEKLWILIARKLTGEASDKDLMELSKEIKDNPEISYMVEILLDFWERTEQPNVKADAATVEKVWERINLFRHYKICYQ